jgi:hypothetical protein
LGLALENALSLVAPAGRFSVVLQLPCEEERGVASTSYAWLPTLKQDFMLIDIGEFQRLLAQKGFQRVSRKTDPYVLERPFGLVYTPKAAMRARAPPNPPSLKRIAPNLRRRESGFRGRMVERPRQPAAAIDVARRVSAHLGQGNAPDWIETALADGVPGLATVVNHSIVWQYLSNVDRARFDRVMAVAGEAATHNELLAGFAPSQPTTSPKSACNSGPAAMTGCWPEGVHGKPVRSG